MRRPLALWHAVACVVPLLVCLVMSAQSVQAQERMDDVVILKSGRELFGYAVVDSVHKVVRVRTLKGDLVVLPLDSVLAFSQIERVREAPARSIRYVTIEEEVPWTCGRSQPWYFVELRALGVMGETFTFGGEAAAGFRIGPASFGMGIARIELIEKWRTPVFVHLKYHFSSGCVKPFAMLDVGFVYDTFTEKYNIKPAIRATTERYPKMVGVGMGLDFALTKFLDVSVDAGYRFFTLAGDRIAPSCSQDTQVLGYDELHTFFVRAGVTF